MSASYFVIHTIKHPLECREDFSSIYVRASLTMSHYTGGNSLI